MELNEEQNCIHSKRFKKTFLIAIPDINHVLFWKGIIQFGPPKNNNTFRRY